LRENVRARKTRRIAFSVPASVASAFVFQIDCRDEISVRKFDFGVLTLPRPKAELVAAPPVLWMAYGRDLTTQCLRSLAG
jgi:hypothetical protein